MTEKTDTTIMALATELQRLQVAYDEMRSAGEWHRRRNRRKRAEDARRAAEKAWAEGVDSQWKHRPMGNRVLESENPYRPVERVKENK